MNCKAFLLVVMFSALYIQGGDESNSKLDQKIVDLRKNVAKLKNVPTLSVGIFVHNIEVTNFPIQTLHQMGASSSKDVTIQIIHSIDEF